MSETNEIPAWIEEAIQTSADQTKGYARLVIMGVATLLVIIQLLVAYLVVDTQVSSSARASCLRGNDRAVASLHLYHDLIQTNTGRIKATNKNQRKYADDLRVAFALAGGIIDPDVVDVVLGTPGPNIYGRHQYRKDLDDFIASFASRAIAPYADRPDGVRVDCNAANPYPAPISWVKD